MEPGFKVTLCPRGKILYMRNDLIPIAKLTLLAVTLYPVSTVLLVLYVMFLVELWLILITRGGLISNVGEES